MPEQIFPKALAWLPKEDIEAEALQQIKNVSEMPFIYKHIAVMPDCHYGMGATVGTVMPSRGAVIPAAVGVDIGCGMIAVKLNASPTALAKENIVKLRDSIARTIPLSAGNYNRSLTDTAKVRIKELEDIAEETTKDRNYYDRFSTRTNWRYQLGTLGSGNHFIEVLKDDEEPEDQCLWIVLHSGSRGVGLQTATHHIDVAKKLMEKWHINLVDPDLSYLVQDTQEYDDYMRDLNWAQTFALRNREEMMDRVLREVRYYLGFEVEELSRVNCHHNFSQMENHMGKNLLISRKGAIKMEEGDIGIIPGSMGTSVYIVKGLGNEAAFCSAPHGAGRKMSRTKARQQYTLQDLEAVMGDIEYVHSKEFIDEAPMAYKDINEVVERSKDLFEVEAELHQIINVKGN